jgi:8-oxo-dGTP pyrophosphatase MutT (NUDIX family)
MPQEYSIGVIVHYDKEFLILKHKDGYWKFPKGVANFTESKEDNARRIAYDTLNMTGIFIAKDFKGTESYFFMKDGKIIHKDVEYALAQASDKNIFPSENYIDYKWLPFEQAIAIIPFKETKNSLKSAYDYLRSH